jgi:type II secretory pathway pseudopilin PulG
MQYVYIYVDIIQESVLIKKSQHSYFTLVEAVVVLAVIALLLSLLQPSFTRMMEASNSVLCKSRMGFIGAMLSVYIEDNNQTLVSMTYRKSRHIMKSLPNPVYPDASRWWWPDLMHESIKEVEQITCPSVLKYGIGINYPNIGAHMSEGRSFLKIINPSQTVGFADNARIDNFKEKNPDLWLEEKNSNSHVFFRTPRSPAYWGADPRRAYGRHFYQVNNMFSDGRVESLDTSDIGFQFRSGHPQAKWDEH